MSSVGIAEVQDLLGTWWWNYDEGNFDVLASLLTDDVRFSCRTDTGATDYEDFVRADLHGRDAVMAWQIDHRTNSPYPLRHNGTNVHVVDQRDGETRFRSYILVTHVVARVITPVSTAIVNGAARRVDDAVRLAELEVILDTRDSVVFAER